MQTRAATEEERAGGKKKEREGAPGPDGERGQKIQSEITLFSHQTKKHQLAVRLQTSEE